MTLRGMGHGLSTTDKVKAIAIEYIRKRFHVKDPCEVERTQFEGGLYSIHSHYVTDNGYIRYFIVKLDKNGDVVDGTDTKLEGELR